MAAMDWDAKYSGSDYAYGLDPNEFLAAKVRQYVTAGQSVLSIGEGEGRNAAFMGRCGLKVVGIDGSAVALAKARKLVDQQGLNGLVEFVHGDLTELPFAESVDVVVSIFCHLPPPVRSAVHTRCEAALKQGGIVIIELYRPEQLALATGGPRDVTMLATLDMLRQDFAGCELVEGAELERSVIEGKLHTGQAAVVQAVFRKR